MNPFDQIARKHGDRMYVILVKDDAGKLTLLADPGMGRPWSINGENPIKNKSIADFHAKNCDGMACTWNEAFALLRKENPQFEKMLYDRIANAAKRITPPINKNDGKLLDRHGRAIQ